MEGDPRAQGPRLLVLGAGPAQLGLLEAARRRGLWVAVVDRDPAAPGFRVADRRCILSTEDEPAIERVIEAPIDDVAGEVINVATGIDLSVTDVADLVLRVLGKPADLRRHVDERPGQVDRHIGSTDKSERLLGWRARTSFEDGLERTVAWYRENEAWWRAILARKARAFSS